MSMQVKDSNMKSNIKQGSQVESLPENASAVPLSISAIERQIVLKEVGKNNSVHMKKEKVIQFPDEVSIIVNQSDNDNLSCISEHKSSSEKEPVVGMKFSANLSQNNAEDDDALSVSLNISSQLSQIDFEDGEETKDLQKQVN